jgi:hypothetical protein
MCWATATKLLYEAAALNGPAIDGRFAVPQPPKPIVREVLDAGWRNEVSEPYHRASSMFPPFVRCAVSRAVTGLSLVWHCVVP